MNRQLIIQKHDLQPSRPDFKVLGVFNPAVTTFKDETILIARVAETVIQFHPTRVAIPYYANGQYEIISLLKNNPDYDFSDARIVRNHKQNFLTSVSHFCIGRSKDGIHFSFDIKDVIFPATPYEIYGIEDPRITLIEGRYYITYSAVSDFGINVALMVTDDFKHFERLGLLFPSDNKDCVLFPQKIIGSYWAFHRPSATEFGKLDMWTATSPDLLSWGHHLPFSEARIHYAPSVRVGAGAVPVLTSKGWLVIYHSADEHHHYHLTAMLLDAKNPREIIAQSQAPLLSPEVSFEQQGFVNNVVFTCGVIAKEEHVDIYYGVCDEAIAIVRMSLDEIWKNMGVIK